MRGLLYILPLGKMPRIEAIGISISESEHISLLRELNDTYKLFCEEVEGSYLLKTHVSAIGGQIACEYRVVPNPANVRDPSVRLEFKDNAGSDIAFVLGGDTDSQNFDRNHEMPRLSCEEIDLDFSATAKRQQPGDTRHLLLENLAAMFVRYAENSGQVAASDLMILKKLAEYDPAFAPLAEIRRLFIIALR